jgi:hypothetical protein
MVRASLLVVDFDICSLHWIMVIGVKTGLTLQEEGAKF